MSIESSIEDAREVLDGNASISKWERDFLESIVETLEKGTLLSDSQQDKLTEVMGSHKR